MPIQTIIMMGLMFVFLAVYFFWTKKRMAKAETDSANSRAGALAATMGLQVVEGDPMTNLAMASYNNASKANNEETRVVLEGSPGGRVTRLYYYHRQNTQTGFTSSTITTWIGAEVSVAVHAPFPEFEVVQRVPGYFGEELTPKLAAPPHSTGDANVDAKLLVKTHDARAAHALASSLLTPATWGFVHIHGKDSKLTFYATKSSIGYLGIADQIQHVLNQMAAHLEAAAAAHLPR